MKKMFVDGAGNRRFSDSGILVDSWAGKFRPRRPY
jgi:hypothetical protein